MQQQKHAGAGQKQSPISSNISVFARFFTLGCVAHIYCHLHICCRENATVFNAKKHTLKMAKTLTGNAVIHLHTHTRTHTIFLLAHRIKNKWKKQKIKAKNGCILFHQSLFALEITILFTLLFSMLYIIIFFFK